MDTASYSLEYLAAWSSRQEDPRLILKAGELIQKTVAAVKNYGMGTTT
ncbi:MAG: hypothetical protein ACOY9Y_12135 [Bacillota bacterium]